MPVAAVPNSRRRSRSIVSEVLMVSMVSLLGLMVCSCTCVLPNTYPHVDEITR